MQASRLFLCTVRWNEFTIIRFIRWFFASGWLDLNTCRMFPTRHSGITGVVRGHITTACTAHDELSINWSVPSTHFNRILCPSKCESTARVVVAARQHPPYKSSFYIWYIIHRICCAYSLYPTHRSAIASCVGSFTLSPARLELSVLLSHPTSASGKKWPPTSVTDLSWPYPLTLQPDPHQFLAWWLPIWPAYCQIGLPPLSLMYCKASTTNMPASVGLMASIFFGLTPLY